MSDLVTISINCNIKTIGAGAFKGLNRLKAANLPNGVATIGNQAFYGATALVSIALPDSLLSIGNEAFLGCTSLANIALPSSNYRYPLNQKVIRKITDNIYNYIK